jgi:hypothetical protein
MSDIPAALAGGFAGLFACVLALAIARATQPPEGYKWVRPTEDDEDEPEEELDPIALTEALVTAIARETFGRRGTATSAGVRVTASWAHTIEVAPDAPPRWTTGYWRLELAATDGSWSEKLIALDQADLRVVCLRALEARVAARGAA